MRFELLAHGFSAAHAHAHKAHSAGGDTLDDRHADLGGLAFRHDFAFGHGHQDFTAHSSALARHGRIDESAGRIFATSGLNLQGRLNPVVGYAISRSCSSTIASGSPALASTGSAVPAAASRSRLSKNAARFSRVRSETDGLFADGPR